MGKSIISDIDLCYGCSACYSSCPVRAISMVKNDKGYFIPEIDEDNCIDCGLCRRKCPRLNVFTIKNESEIYAVKNKNDAIRSESQSGGAFWAVCEYIFSNNGIVYGCAMDSGSHTAVHVRAATLEEAKAFHGSKYIQSNLVEEDIFRSVRKDLDNNILVLFAGTPCQVAGLKSFIGKHDENLLTIDLVCFGVSSPLIWQGYINQLESIYKGKCIDAKFRNKKFGWQSHFSTVAIRKSNGRTVVIKDTSFKNIFLGRYASRDSCFDCQFRSINRVGDFTMGDCWGIEKTRYKDFADDKGVSLLIINNQKAKFIANQIWSDFESRRLTSEEVLQPALISAGSIPRGREKFWDEYCRAGISSILLKYGSWKYRMNYIFRKALRL